MCNVMLILNRRIVLQHLRVTELSCIDCPTVYYLRYTHTDYTLCVNSLIGPLSFPDSLETLRNITPIITPSDALIRH